MLSGNARVWAGAKPPAYSGIPGEPVDAISVPKGTPSVNVPGSIFAMVSAGLYSYTACEAQVASFYAVCVTLVLVTLSTGLLDT